MCNGSIRAHHNHASPAYLPMEQTPSPDLRPPQLGTWQAMQANHALWTRLATSPRTILLDYDGTLAPFVPQGMRAPPYPGIPELVGRLMHCPRTRVALVSGRPAELVASLMGLDPAPEIWGCHGLEHQDARGVLSRTALAPGLQEGLDAAEAWAEARRHSGYLEYKPGCLALHVRGLPKAKADFLLKDTAAAWKDIAARAPLELHAFDGGLELRPRGVHKGHAVAAMRKDAGPDHVFLYLGDDKTDEDAFRALSPGDVAVLVRGEYRPTAAAWWLQPPGELLDFLQALLDLPDCINHGGAP